MASSNYARFVTNIDKVRQEITLFRTQLHQILSANPTPAARNAARELFNHIKANEALLEKADAKVQRLRLAGRLVSRPTVPVPASKRAKRALSVLSAADPDTNDVRSVRRKTARPKYLTLAGKKPATPIREEELPALFKRASQIASANLVMLKTGGVKFDWQHIFSAYIWFKDVPPPGDAKPKADGKPAAYVIPEHIACFRTDETGAGRWSRSVHAVFNVMTERAQAAIRYFMAREDTGEDAFIELILWLVKHNNIFSAKCDDRRLAFDASRGIFLPPCVHPFDGSGPARFTRGTIPVRSTTTQQNTRPSHGSQAARSQISAAVHASQMARRV
ncbi:Mediator complex subunit Med27 [Gracilaria domingensis]|nr:Mediator complex subunit Med27 [Gracilaria domingensis]